MASIDFTVFVIAKTSGIFSFGKYSVKGRHLTRLTNHLFVNMTKHFAVKLRNQGPSKNCCENIAGKLNEDRAKERQPMTYVCKCVKLVILLQPLICLAVNFKA